MVSALYSQDNMSALCEDRFVTIDSDEAPAPFLLNAYYDLVVTMNQRSRSRLLCSGGHNIIARDPGHCDLVVTCQERSRPAARSTPTASATASSVSLGRRDTP